MTKKEGERYRNKFLFKKKLLRILEIIIFGKYDNYLQNSEGVIHIGANNGYEKKVYKKYNVKRVIWIEADPFIFKKLQNNIQSLKNHKAYQRLMLNLDKKSVNFNIMNNEGNSSSIYKPKDHLQIVPNVKIVKTINLISTTLKSFIKKESIKIDNFDTLVVDTQGSELLILKGASNLINKFKFISIEVTEFELYEKTCLFYQVANYLNRYNFKEIKRNEHWSQPNYYGRKTFDVLYKNLTLLPEDKSI
jgi:FkbM family methyltransferase